MKDPDKQSVRFALVIEIDAGTVESDLYTEVKTAIDNLNVVSTVV